MEEKTNTIVYVDSKGDSKFINNLPDNCKVILQIQNGKAVYMEKTEKCKLSQPLINLNQNMKRVKDKQPHKT